MIGWCNLPNVHRCGYSSDAIGTDRSDMTDTSAVIAAAGASVAAVLSGANIYVGWRWQHQSWVRETLHECLVTFMDASFAMGGACSVAARTRQSDPDNNLSRLHEDASSEHQRLLEAMTRIRFLANPAVVRAAEDLHQCLDDSAEIAFGHGSAIDIDQWRTIRVETMELRVALYNATRKSLRLSADTTIRETTIGRSW